MTAKTTSEPQEDPNVLPLTPELENVDITAVYRKGSIHTNFVVIFKRKDKDLILYMKPQRDKTRSELEKTLKNYSKNKTLIEDLRVTLESYIVEYFDQMCGIGSNAESEEFTEELNDNEKENPFDRYLDKNENDPLFDYQEIDIEKAAQLHRGKIKFTGRISAITPEIIQLVSKSRWICRVCDNVIEIPFTILLSPPRSPKKCSCSQTDRGFDPDHELINARLLKIESDDITRQNPRNENWENKRKLELSDIPLTDRIISRFDIIVPIRELMTEKEWKDYADFISNRTIESISVNYELLMKYLEYARRIKFVTFDSEAREMINSYAARCAMNKDLAYITSKRIVHTIHRITGTFARLYLSETVTVEIAQKVIDFINQIIKRINLNKASFLKPTIDPLVIVINSILKLNPSKQRSIVLTNHIEGLCQESKVFDAAIGMQDNPRRRFKRNQNTTLDTLCHKITQDSRIGVTGSWKEKVYVIRELEEKSQDLEIGRGGRGGRGDLFDPVNKKNIDIFDGETEREKQATKELEEALSQSN